jgi:hypothetical protein
MVNGNMPLLHTSLQFSETPFRNFAILLSASFNKIQTPTPARRISASGT